LIGFNCLYKAQFDYFYLLMTSNQILDFDKSRSDIRSVTCRNFIFISDKSPTVLERRKEGTSLPLQLRAISVHPAVAARPPDRERRRSRGAAMKITALLVLKPSSSGAGASSSASSGSGSGTEALVLANATDVSHFGYFQRNAAREFIAFVARTVAQRTPPGQRQSVQHEGSLPGTDLFSFLLRFSDPWFARILLRLALRCGSSGSLICGTRIRGGIICVAGANIALRLNATCFGSDLIA
jgi:hypothetical protein